MRPTNIIGGSDAAALMDYYYPDPAEPWSPHRTAFDVYASIVEGVERDDNLSMRLGRAAEDAIIDDWCERNGFDPAAIARKIRFTDPARAWRSGELDGVHIAEQLGLEAKLVRSPRQQANWRPGERAPAHYICQCAWYRSLSGVERMMLVAALNNGPCEVEYREQPDLEAALLECADKFWTDHILKQIPPPSHGADPESVRAVWPTETTALRTPTESDLIVIQEWRDAREECRKADARQEKAESALIARIADSEGFAFASGKPLTYKAQVRKTVNAKTLAVAAQIPQALVDAHTTSTTFRVLRAPSDWSK